jgi:hypothetical protein
VKPFGPAQAYDVPPVAEEPNLSWLVTGTGELLLAVAKVGGVQVGFIAFTTTLVVAVAVQVPDDVMVTV